jgi:hypothetical protein
LVARIAELEQMNIDEKKFGNNLELELLRTEDKGHLLPTIKQQQTIQQL